VSTIFEDNFNSYTDGDLNGQGGWSGNAVFDIQGTTVYEGAKAVYEDGSAIDATISKTGTSTNDGRVTFYIRPAQTNARFEFQLYEGTTRCVRLYFGDDGNIYIYGNGGWQSIKSYSANTWYDCEIEWESTNHTVRARINEGTWTNWYNPYATWTNGLDKILLNTQNPAGNFYIDYIAEYPYPLSPIFSDNFNSYNDGDLNGQGGWSGDTKFDVQELLLKKGQKRLK